MLSRDQDRPQDYEVQEQEQDIIDIKTKIRSKYIEARDVSSLKFILITRNKYVLWNAYLPNVVAFHTPLSKYLTVIVMTVN